MRTQTCARGRACMHVKYICSDMTCMYIVTCNPAREPSASQQALIVHKTPLQMCIYWINPVAWSIRAVAINELTSSRWSQPMDGGTLGEAVLATFGFYAERCGRGGGGHRLEGCRGSGRGRGRGMIAFHASWWSGRPTSPPDGLPAEKHVSL